MRGTGFAGSVAFVAGGVSLIWIGMNDEFPKLKTLFAQPGDTPAVWAARVKSAPLPVALFGLSAVLIAFDVIDPEIATLMLWIIILIAVIRRSHILALTAVAPPGKG